MVSTYYTTPSGTKTHYVQVGDPQGQLLIGMHGLGGSTETYTPLLSYIPKSYRIILVDFQGLGLTPLTNPEKPISISGHVEDLHALISHLQESGSDAAKGKVVIFGHSLGTIVGMHYTAQYPDNVAGLAMFGAGRSASHIPAARQRMLDMAANTRSQGIAYAADLASKSNFPSDEQRPVPAENRKAVTDAVAASDPEGYAQTCEAVMSLDHKDPDYSKITCPAVFVAGDLDFISPMERSEDLSNLLAGDSWVEVVKAGHQPILDDPEAAGAAVKRLLEKIRT